MAIFATAYGAAAFGALRTYAMWYLFYRTYNVSWQLWEIWNWTILELHIGVICANAPALKAFIKKYLEPIRSIASNPRGQFSQAKSSQAQSFQTGSKARSDLSEKSKFFWKNPYGAHGYFSQPTRLSQKSEDELFGCEGIEDHTKHDSIQSERSASRDVELGLVPPRPTHLAPSPQTQRGSLQSVGIVSVYMYDQNEGDETNREMKYMRTRV